MSHERTPTDDPPDVSVPDDTTAPSHQVPQGVDDATVTAVGKLTAALEIVEQARGMLYGFHRLTGSADDHLAEALDALVAAGHTDLAEGIRTDLYGRNILGRRWTFQVVEEYDDGYWQAYRDWERRAREELMQGRRHVYEAQLKEQNRTHGRRGHEAGPTDER